MARRRHLIPKPIGAKLGQHFIKDIDAMYSAILQLPKLDLPIVEIGGGSGDLSDIILNVLDDSFLHIVDIDKKCINFLKQKYKNNPRISIHHNDAINSSILPDLLHKSNMQMIANIPYCITQKLLEHIYFSSPQYQLCALMVQKEVGYALCQKHTTSKYKALLGAVVNTTKIQDFHKSAFTPTPGVDSCFILMTPKPSRIQDRDKKSFLTFVKTLYSKKAKTLKHLSQQIEVLSKEENKLILSKRAHELSVDNIIDLFLQQNNML